MYPSVLSRLKQLEVWSVIIWPEALPSCPVFYNELLLEFVRIESVAQMSHSETSIQFTL